MPRKAQKIQELYNVRIKDWEKALASISRKLTRDLEREGFTCSLKHRIKTLEGLDIKRKADKLSFREFAYDSVHMIVAIPRTAEIELLSGCLNACEVQIRTILQGAWAEVEHELIYKTDAGS